jgi:TolB-like protein
MLRNTVLFIFIILFFTSCLKTYPDYYKFKYVQSTEITDFKAATNKLVMQMENKLLSIKPRVNSKYIYVVDFVNIRNLELTSQLGFFLSSEVKAHVSNKFDLNVKEIEYMKYFKFGVDGSKLLSRDLDEVNMNNLNQTYALVGTYAITQRQLIMYLKLIDMSNGNILKTTSHSIELTEEIMKLEEVVPNKKRAAVRPRVVL